MKKTYINPKMVVVKMSTCTQMLAGSFDSNNLDGDQTVQINGGTHNGSFGSRGYDFDDEEDW